MCLQFINVVLCMSIVTTLITCEQNSAKIIRASVFGLDERGKVKGRFVFPSNSLVITSIDIQSVEPVDQRTRDALQKSVQLAIEITTNSQEATARYVHVHVEKLLCLCACLGGACVYLLYTIKICVDLDWRYMYMYM